MQDKKRLIWKAAPRIFSVPNPPKMSKKRKKRVRKIVDQEKKEEKIKPTPETPTKRRLKKAVIQVKSLNNAVRGKKREIVKLKKRLKETTKIEKVIEAMKPYLSKDEHELVSLQMRLSVKKRKVYSNYFKAFAVAIYFKSPICYRFLQTRFRLPCKATINRWMRSINFQEGFCENMLKLLKIRIETLPVQER